MLKLGGFAGHERAGFRRRNCASARPRFRPDDAINIQYTSGTTGFPKGATLSHYNVVNNGLLIGDCMKLTEHDRVCIPVPFYHCFGMVLGNMSCLTHGSAMVIPADYFDPLETHARPCQEERCTAIYGVPTMFIAEFEHPQFKEFDLTSLRTGIMAGSTCPIELMRRMVNEMHCRELTICLWLDRVLARHYPDPDRRSAGASRHHRGQGAAPHRSQNRRSQDRPDRAARHERRDSAPAATW